MTKYTDESHDPKLTSWVESANLPGADFPIQNLPFGVFVRDDLDEVFSSHVGVAIGDQVLDLTEAVDEGVLDVDEDVAADFYVGALNELLMHGPEQWRRVRRAVSELLRAGNATVRDDAALPRRLLVPQTSVTMELPAHIGDYTDFYASIHHATNVGSMFRPDNPLLPNYKHLPVGYHGRASSIVVSGTPVRRPMGQTVASDAGPPGFGPSKLLDYEMELGFFVGPGNELGTRISMKDAAQHIFGMVIVNDWSARDVQKWEYQPLGPFNAKNFATTISPWVVTLDALGPFRVNGPVRGEGDPELLEYLRPMDDFGLEITVEVWLSSKAMREAKTQAEGAKPSATGDLRQAVLVSRGSFREMYWTIAQMLVHHTSTGCNMQPGDLIATGTISGPTEDSRGSLLERAWRGTQPFKLPDGSERKFLQDGDEVIMRAYCDAPGKKRIGFGECRGIILPAQ
jgi:fumarylacetoacetase